MGQIEVYEFLKTQRLTGNKEFLSVNEIYKGMASQGLGVCHKNSLYVSLIQLERFEYVEVKMRGSARDWHRLFRLKLKYCVKPKIENPQ